MALMGDRIGDEIVAYSMKEHYRTKTAFKVEDLHPELGIKAWEYFQENLQEKPSQIRSFQKSIEDSVADSVTANSASISVLGHI